MTNHFNRAELEKINKCIFDAQIARFSQEETVDYIKKKLGFEISISKIARQRARIRQDGKELIDMYRRDSYAYKLEFMDCISVTKRLIEVELKSFEESLDEGDEDKKEKCISTLERLLSLRANFVQFIPSIDRYDVIPQSTESGSIQGIPTISREQATRRKF